MLKIAGAKVFRNGEFVEDDIFIEGDRIVATGDEVGEVIDAKGLLAIPGLVDVHSHGAVGHDFCDGTHESIDAITRYEASRGVTAWCGTTMTFPEEKLAGIMECAAEHVDAPDAAALVGINMEGPFISPEKVGAQNPAYVQQCNAAMFCRLQNASSGKIKLVDIAPEEPGALEFVDEMHDAVRISVAHTCANYDQAAEAFRRGAKHVTLVYRRTRKYMPADEHELALALADGFRPEAGYREAAHTLWAAAAPYARQQPLACAGLIDAANFTLSGSPEAQTRPQ